MSYKIRTLGPMSEFQTNYGPMKQYSVQFEGSEDWIQLNQKPESPAPTVGQELDGTIEDTKFGKKFKKAQAQGGFQGGRADSPEQRASIERQTALKAAVEATSNARVQATQTPDEVLSSDQYIDQIIMNAKKFAAFLHNANAQTTVKADDNLPPITNYDGMS